MIETIRDIFARERGATRPVLALALLSVLAAAVVANVQYVSATIGNSGGHTDVGFDVTSSFDAQTTTWTYEVSGEGPHAISHITIGICDAAAELVSVQDWSPDADSKGQDPSTGFPADGSGLTGYKWEGEQKFTGTYSFTLPGFPNDASGAEAVIKASQDHEHFAGLDGPDCDAPTPTDTPEPTATDTPEPTPMSTPTDTPPEPTDTPEPTATSTSEPTDVPPETPEPSPTGITPTSEVLETAVGPTPTDDVSGLPTTGGGGPGSGSSILLYLALAALGGGSLLLGYWRYRTLS